MDYKALYEAQVEENKQLKEAIVSQNIRKIKELRAEINELKNKLELANERKMPYGWTKESCKNLIDHNKELKEENKQLQFKLDYALNGTDPDCIDEWKKDKEKIEELEKKNKELWSDFKNTRAEIEGVAVENIGLKDLIKKFKQERKTIWETMSKDPALVLLLPDSMSDADVDSESEEEQS